MSAQLPSGDSESKATLLADTQFYSGIYKRAGIFIVVSKCLSVLFFFLVIASATWYYSTDLIPGVRLFLMGFELSVLFIIILSMVRSYIYIPYTDYNASNITDKKPRLIELLGKINYDVQRYQSASYNYYQTVRYFRYSTIILAGLSTILLGLHFDNQTGWLKTGFPTASKNLALIIGTVITIYTSLMSFFNIEKYWLINKTIANKLKSLMDEIEDDDKAGKLAEDKNIDKKVEEYRKIKGDFYKYWEGALSDKGAPGGQMNK